MIFRDSRKFRKFHIWSSKFPEGFFIFRKFRKCAKRVPTQRAAARTARHATTMYKRRKCVDAASAVLGALSRAQRQMVAVTFGEATARRAKSVQCTLDRKGRLCTSVYLDWPPHSREPNPDEPDDDMEDPDAQSKRAPINPPTAPARRAPRRRTTNP